MARQLIGGLPDSDADVLADLVRAALVDRERTLIEMHVGPVVVAGLEGDVGRIGRPIAARDDHSDAVEQPNQRQARTMRDR
jgi:hypothetical protein